MPQPLLLKLPHEVLLYILKQYLDLTDLWTLTRASKDLRCIALLVLKKQWSVGSDSLLKSQMNAAMIAVSGISQRIIKRITIYDPYAFPPILPQNPQNPRNWLFLTLTDTTVYDLAIYQHPLPDQYVSEARSPSPPNTFPPTIEPGLDEGSEHFFPMERIKYQCKRLHYIIEDERKLHYQIARNITKENLNAVIESILHHVIFVNGRWMIMSRRQSAIAISRARAFSAATTRLLCSLGDNLKNEVADIVWKNMSIFITYVELLFLGKSNGNSNLMDTITVFLNFVCACYVAHIIVDEQALDAFYRVYHVTSKIYKDQTRSSLRELWLRTDRDLEDSPLSRYLNLSL